MITNENVTRLSYQGKEIILIATAHVSEGSVALVREVIAEERPDSVCIELDEGRYQNIRNPDAWEKTDVVEVIKQKRVGFLMANMALSSYQRKIAKNLGTKVGGEMLEGMASAEEYGADLILADRSIQATFLRIWRKLGFIEKSKLIFSLVFALDDDEEITDETLEEMLRTDALEAVMSSMRKEFPKIGEILISERDQHLANKIKNAPGEKIVAILGAAHVPGVKEEIYKEQDMAEITTVPPKSRVSSVVGWIIPAIIFALVIYGFTNNLETGLRQLSLWVLWTGTLAAAFTALSLAHPLSILTSFVVAPISTLNPVLACGWFTGLVEAAIKKPTVKDVQEVPTVIFTFKGFFKNRFLKIILVVIMANIGSTIGTFVAGTDMIRTLFS